LWYIFSESSGDITKDPLLLWHNGGPGCSTTTSFFQAFGPFNIQYANSDTVLHENPYSVHQFAGVIYLDSPKWTGYSYSNVSNKLMNDSIFGEEKYRFMQGWYKKFPQYLKNDLYLGGQSYAGHFIPWTAYAIVTGNEAKQAGVEQIPLKGMILFNPLTDYPNYDFPGYVTYHQHSGLISDVTAEWAREACTGGGVDKFMSDECTQARAMMSKESQISLQTNSANWNEKYIIAESCPKFPNVSRRVNAVPSCSFTVYDSGSGVPNLNDCAGIIRAIYLDRPSVKTALNVAVGLVRDPYTSCSEPEESLYDKSNNVTSVVWLYDWMIKKGGYKIWIASGALDAIFPHLGTHAAVRSLNRTLTPPSWHLGDADAVPWWVDDPSEPSNVGVAGLAAYYDGITFVTVRGGGHSIGETARARTQYLMATYLSKAKYL